MSTTTALEGWRTITRNHREFLLTSPEGHAVHYSAAAVIRELTAEIADLRAQLDARDNVPVVLCTERSLDDAMLQVMTEPPQLGTVLRTTDTLREFEYRGADDGWRERART